MNISPLELIELIADDELAARLARRAMIAAIGFDRADDCTASVRPANFDRAIALLESPSMDDHIKSGALLGVDPEESFMREAHAVNLAARTLTIAASFAKD